MPTAWQDGHQESIPAPNCGSTGAPHDWHCQKTCGSLRRAGPARRGVDPDAPDGDAVDPVSDEECLDRTRGFLGMTCSFSPLVVVAKERQAGVPPLGELVEVAAVIGIDIAMDEALPRQAQERHRGGGVREAETVGDLRRVGPRALSQVFEQIVLGYDGLPAGLRAAPCPSPARRKVISPEPAIFPPQRQRIDVS